MLASMRGRVKQTERLPGLSGLASRGQPLRILFFHNDVADVDLCVRALRGAHLNVSADVAPTSALFIERLRAGSYDVVVAAHAVSDPAGAQSLEALRRME